MRVMMSLVVWIALLTATWAWASTWASASAVRPELKPNELRVIRGSKTISVDMGKIKDRWQKDGVTIVCHDARLGKQPFGAPLATSITINPRLGTSFVVEMAFPHYSVRGKSTGWRLKASGKVRELSRDYIRVVVNGGRSEIEEISTGKKLAKNKGRLFLWFAIEPNYPQR